MTYENEAIRVKTMLAVTTGTERAYWEGYRIGMIDAQAGRDQRADNPGWRGLNSPDKLRAARCRGYAAGIEWKGGVR